MSKKQSITEGLNIYQKMHYWDVFISSLIHQHESLLLTVMLFLPAMIFSPKMILFPIYLIYSLNGWEFLIIYLVAISITLLVTLRMKKYLGRPRPKQRPGMILKPMYFRSMESNNSMPSGDSAQAGCFIIFYFLGGSQFDPLLNYFFFLLVINVMLARVYFCCHFILDTVVGLIIGITIASFTLITAHLIE